METTAPFEISGLRSVSTLKALLFTFGVSAGVVVFLLWLLYFRTGGGAPPAEWLRQLPALNAALNALSSVLLVTGFVMVKRRDYRRHMRFMVAAGATSALFFASYITYHHYFGSTRFQGQGPVRYVYFFILLTHVVLAAVVLPLILLSFFLSLSGRLSVHRRVSRFTFPIWLYVSVTGVLVFGMLKMFSK